MRNPDPHGHTPEKSAVVVLLVDLVNDLDFPDNKGLLRQLPPFTRALVRLKEHARRRRLPVIYVNDNFGRWQSDFSRQVEYCCRPESPGRVLVERLRPEPNDYFVLKPMHSGFFRTCLDNLLENLGATTLVIAGIAADRCVLFTASDAHLRGYRVIIPGDCVIAATPQDKRQALSLMRRVLQAEVRPVNALWQNKGMHEQR